MKNAHPSEYEQILNIVRSWPFPQRLALFQEVLKTIASPETKQASKQSLRTLDQARGLLISMRSAPSDDEIARWLEEKRSQRYNL